MSDAVVGPNATLTYTYAHRPRQELEKRSKPHLGTAALDVVGMKPSAISGAYFTDRYTKGAIQLTLFDRSTGHPDYAAAQRHCAPPPLCRLSVLERGVGA
jgi:hypothetical protein